MTRYLVTLLSQAHRDRAIKMIEQAPSGSRVEIKAAKRSMPQNDKMWSMLTEISRQVLWHGQRLRPDEFKLIFLNALKRELRPPVKNLDGTGWVDLSRSSSDLSKSEMSDLIELINAWAAQNSVVFSGDDNAQGVLGQGQGSGVSSGAGGV